MSRGGAFLAGKVIRVIYRVAPRAGQTSSISDIVCEQANPDGVVTSLTGSVIQSAANTYYVDIPVLAPEGDWVVRWESNPPSAGDAFEIDYQVIRPATTVTVVLPPVTSHGELTGLNDDDHTQYLLRSLLTAKGSLPVATSAGTIVELTLGANGSVLTADATAVTGVRWSTPTTYDIRTYGAVGDGTTDDTAAIQAAIDACEAAGGGTVSIPTGNWMISAPITVPNGVSLYGAGSLWGANATTHASRIVCSTTTAKIIVDDGGGTFGNFCLDGDSIATGPLLHRRLGAERYFTTMLVQASNAGEGIRVDEAQNDQWVACQTDSHATCLILDNGAGGNSFRGCEFSCTSGWHVVITETTGTGPYAAGPTDNVFDHCLLEYGPRPSLAGPHTGSLDIRAGSGTLFRKCVIVGDGTTVALVRVDETSPIVTFATAVFEECRLYGDPAADTGMWVGNATVAVRSGITFQQLLDAWRIESTALLDVADTVTYLTVTNRLHASSTGTWNTMRHYQSRPILMDELEAADSTAYRVSRRGEASARWLMAGDGGQSWGPGSAGADTYLYRAGVGQLNTLAKFFVGTELEVDGALNHDGSTVGFYGATPVVKAASPGTASGTDAAVVNAVITALRNLGLVT